MLACAAVASSCFVTNPGTSHGRPDYTDLLRFAVAFALRGARKLVRGLRQELARKSATASPMTWCSASNSTAIRGGSPTSCRR